MKLEIGSEKRFFDFVKNLTDTDTIALISHTDLDGLVAAKVANEVLDANIVKFVNYEELTQSLVDELKNAAVTKIVFTDLFIGNETFLRALEGFAQVLIIDHHITQKDWNSARTVFLKGEDGYCAGYLCYSLFSHIQSLEFFDWLVACSCVSDYCHIKTAEWLSSVYTKYNDVFEQRGLYVRTDGPLWDLQELLSLAIIYYKDLSRGLYTVFEGIGKTYGNIGSLRERALEVKSEIGRLVSLYNSERIPFPGGYFFLFTPRFPCSSMVSTIVSAQEIDKIVITARPDPELDYYHVSVRRQDKKQDMSAFLKKLLHGLEDSDGGGHIPAAGGHFLKKDLHEFKRRLGIKA
ncbi:MAG: hypothetical protein AABX53_01810 [Nanoarchaeota archaeon]